MPKPQPTPYDMASVSRPRNWCSKTHSIERLDDRENYGEERFNIIGMVEGRILFVSYTVRNDVIRIISARGAEPYERRRYHEENS
jgi:uncharacterized DUF497 family protein